MSSNSDFADINEQLITEALDALAHASAATSPDAQSMPGIKPGAAASDLHNDLFDFQAYGGLNGDGVSSPSDDSMILSPLNEMTVDPLFLAQAGLSSTTPPPCLSPVTQSLYSVSSSHGSPDPFESVASPSSFTFEAISPSAMMAGLVAPMQLLAHATGNVTNQAPAAHNDDQEHEYQAHDQDEPPVVTAVRIDSDQLVDANAGTSRHEFNGESWRLTYVKTKDGKYALSVRAPIVVTATGGGPIDLDWKAVLVEVSQPANRVDAAHVKSIVDDCDLDDMLEDGTAFTGTVTHTSARELSILLQFSVKIRKKYFLAIVVNEVGVAGAPNIIQVHGDRNTRTRGGNKRKVQETEQDDEDDADDSPSESPTVGKRAKLGGGARAAATEAAQSASSSPTLPPMQQTQGPFTVTPPPSPDLALTTRIHGALHTMIEATSFFDPRILELLQMHRIEASDAQVAASLVYALHVASDHSSWTPAEIVDTLRRLSRHADVIRERAWSPASTYPHPMHAIAQCTRPDLVNALFEFLHPSSVLTPTTACPDFMDATHNQMMCDSCRAFAASSVLTYPNAKGFMPIHVAAWNRNTAFVEHHVRIKGAHETFMVANQLDRGNFFHATCASLSAVDWLEMLWTTVIVGESDRLVVARALKMRNRRGRTPVDMALFQLEDRPETAGLTRRRTYEWVVGVVALL